MENAIRIKQWSIQSISSTAWVLVTSRAMPELFSLGVKSVINIHAQTKFTAEQIEVLNRHFEESFKVSIPDEIRYSVSTSGKNDGQKEMKKWLLKLFNRANRKS